MKLSQLPLAASIAFAAAAAAYSDEPSHESSVSKKGASATKEVQPYFHGPRYGLGGNDPWIPKPVPVEAGVVFQPEASPAVVERESWRQKAWEEINAKLNEPVTVRLDGVPLRAGVEQVVTQIGTPLDFDKVAIEEEGLTLEDAVSLELADISAATVLRRLLRPYDLTTIIDGEVLVVTTRASADEHLTTRAYPVADLVVPAEGGDAAPGTQSVVSTIQQSTDGPWLDIDGTGGTISPHYYGGVVAVAVRQTDDIHREIESILYRLRQARSPAAQQALETAPGNDVSRIEREILRLRDGVQEKAEGVGSRIGSMKIQELTPELRAKIEELQTDSRLERLRSEMRSLTPSVRERLEQFRGEATEAPTEVDE